MTDKIVQKIKALLKEKDFLIIAIDGRCASGKTTLAEKLANVIDANVIHMDDFFLPVEKRSEERLKTPGENIDHERFLKEVIMPLRERTSFYYGKYSCAEGKISEKVFVSIKNVNIIEGSYSCHKELREFYDFCIFTDVSPHEQLERIEKRNGKEKLIAFREKWIPMEEMYFNECAVKEKCDMYIPF